HRQEDRPGVGQGARDRHDIADLGSGSPRHVHSRRLHVLLRRRTHCARPRQRAGAGVPLQTVGGPRERKSRDVAPREKKSGGGAPRERRVGAGPHEREKKTRAKRLLIAGGLVAMLLLVLIFWTRAVSAQNDELDVLKVIPENYTLIIDNPFVRVL